MIPSGDDIEEMIVDEDISWMLVVEKEVIRWHHSNWSLISI